MIVVEDLHWIDATSEAWLSELVLRLAGIPVLLLVTYRPGYQAPWLHRSSAVQLALPRLTAVDSALLARSACGGTQISDAALERVVAKAQGNPFFLEELTRTLAAAPLDSPGLPDTVQSVLAARIDQLTPSDKRLLQMTAVVGTTVPLDLLRLVDGGGDLEREQGLNRLQGSEFLYEQRMENERTIVFKHALTQEVAYHSLLGETRRAIHQRIAHALQAHFPALTAERPELLAGHLTDAGDTTKAIEFWRAAGKRAAERSADREAVNHFENALTLMEAAGQREAAEQRLAILLDQGVALQNVRGPGSAEVGAVYARARVLCPGLASPRQNFAVLWGLWRHRVLRGELPAARVLADELLESTQAKNDAEFELQALHAAWTTARFQGDLALAADHARRGIALSRPESVSAPFFAFGGHHSTVCARGALAKVLRLQGFAEQSRSELGKACALADELGHVPMRC